MNWTCIVSAQGNAVWVAEIDVEIIAGWIHVFVKQLLESDHDMEIGGLVVDEASQGQVAGKALVERAERWVIGSPTFAVWGRIFPLGKQLRWLCRKICL